jgi:hypothetical protein
LKTNNKSKFPPQQREEIDLRSIRLRRTPDTEKREKEKVERFVRSVKKERGKEAQSIQEEILPYEEMVMEEKGKKEITSPHREEIDLQSIRMRRTPDTEERKKVEIERFIESIKKERERVNEYLIPEEEIPPSPKEKGDEETSEIKERIPPWAEKIKEEPPQEFEGKEDERKIEEPAELGEDFKEKEIKPLAEEPPPIDEPVPKEEKPPQPADEPLAPVDKPLLSEKEIASPRKVDQIEVRLKTRSDVENIKPDVKNVELGMTPDEVIKVAGSPRYISEWYTGNLKYNYGNVWVVIENGAVTCLVRSKHFEEYWGKSDYEGKNPAAIIK